MFLTEKFRNIYNVQKIVPKMGTQDKMFPTKRKEQASSVYANIQLACVHLLSESAKILGQGNS